ncbi:MAG: hypothetical protein K2K73_00215 [Ureaplasma sp.]|nr:hypothetical protein [Ureaplasma sp.]
MSNTEKSPKKGKGSGRQKKDKTSANIKREIWKEIIDKVPDEFLDDIIGWIKKSLKNDKHKENEKLKKL